VNFFPLNCWPVKKSTWVRSLPGGYALIKLFRCISLCSSAPRGVDFAVINEARDMIVGIIIFILKIVIDRIAELEFCYVK
jgi:hypothetical protein